MDEALDWISQYDDPDPGIYDPIPTRSMLDRAQYAIRASKWEMLLRADAKQGNESIKKSGGAQISTPTREGAIHRCCDRRHRRPGR